MMRAEIPNDRFPEWTSERRIARDAYLKAQLCRTNARVGDTASGTELTMLIYSGLVRSTFEALPFLLIKYSVRESSLEYDPRAQK